jgi:hypothetical protein
LRDQLHLTGTKIGCDRGACGACTVMLGKDAVPSCTVFALDAVGHPVTTIEGLARGEQLAPIQAAFVAHDALQCGFCTPGMVMSCHALLQRNAHPSEEEVRQAVAGLSPVLGIGLAGSMGTAGAGAAGGAVALVSSLLLAGLSLLLRARSWPLATEVAGYDSAKSASADCKEG